MASYFKTIALGCLLSAATVLTACQEGGEAGDLLGQWRIDGSDTRYVSFSGSLALIRNINIDNDVWAQFQHEGDSLFMQCYSLTGSPADTLLVEQTYGFGPFTNIRLRVETLSSDRLVLSRGTSTWNFYKY